MRQHTVIVVFTESGPLLYAHNIWEVAKKPFLETDDAHIWLSKQKNERNEGCASSGWNRIQVYQLGGSRHKCGRCAGQPVLVSA